MSYEKGRSVEKSPLCCDCVDCLGNVLSHIRYAGIQALTCSLASHGGDLLRETSVFVCVRMSVVPKWLI